MKNILLSLAAAGVFVTPGHTQTPAVTAVTAAQPEQCYTDPNAIPLACLQAERTKYFLEGFTDACSQNGRTVVMYGEYLACPSSGKSRPGDVMVNVPTLKGLTAYQPPNVGQNMDQPQINW